MIKVSASATAIRLSRPADLEASNPLLHPLPITAKDTVNLLL